nr:diguanylate cyclase [Pseudomonas duriflava]
MATGGRYDGCSMAPSAVLAAFLIHSRYTCWPLLIACAVVLQMAASAGSGQLVLNSLKLLPATLLEATLSAWLLRCYLPKGAFTRNMGNVMRLLVLGIFIPAVVGATVGSLTLSTLLPTESSKPLSILWMHWYTGDVLGLLALLPISMRSGSLTWRDFTQHSPTEFVGLTILTLILTVLAFRYLPYPYSYTVTLLLLLTIRIKPFGITLIGGLAICLTSLALTAGLIHLPPVNSLLQQTALYIPLALMQIPPLLLSVALQQSSDERQRLALSEARFRNAMRSAPSGMAVPTLSGDIYKANPAFCRLLGYSREDLQNRAMSALTHPEDLSKALSLIGQLLRQEIEDFTLDIRILPKHSSPIWVRATLSPIVEDGGQLYYLLLQTQDIDQQKRLDLETNRLNERMRLATQAAQVGIWELDPESLTFIIDAKMAELYGVPPHDKPIDMYAWLNAVHPEDRTAVHDQLKAAITQCTTYDTEFRIVRSNGVICHVRAEGIVISHSGKAVRIVGSLQDVTGYKQLTEALHEEKERLQVTLASIGDAVLTTDIEGRITFLNPAAEALTGWMLSEARGCPRQDVFRIFNSETLEPLPSPVTCCLETQTILSSNESATLVNSQEERYDIQDSVAPVRTLDGAVIGAVLVFQNVTSARALQRELSYNASHDALTGLFNRLKFEQELNRAWQSAKERHAVHALCFIDLDRFKIVNDSAGHAAGDTLLRELSHLLRDTLRASDTLARLGGDEFGLLLYDCDLPQAEAVANKLIAAISAMRFQWEDRLYDVGASAGIVAITAEARSTAELMSQANVACYAAKHSGRNRAELYQAGREEVEKQHREILLASGLRDALEHDRFTLYA